MEVEPSGGWPRSRTVRLWAATEVEAGGCGPAANVGAWPGRTRKSARDECRSAGVGAGRPRQVGRDTRVEW